MIWYYIILWWNSFHSAQWISDTILNLHTSMVTPPHSWHVKRQPGLLVGCLSLALCDLLHTLQWLKHPYHPGIAPAEPLLALTPLNYQIGWEAPVLYPRFPVSNTIVHKVFGFNNGSIKTWRGSKVQRCLKMYAIYDRIFIHVSIDILTLLYWCCVEEERGSMSFRIVCYSLVSF